MSTKKQPVLVIMHEGRPHVLCGPGVDARTIWIGDDIDTDRGKALPRGKGFEELVKDSLWEHWVRFQGRFKSSWDGKIVWIKAQWWKGNARIKFASYSNGGPALMLLDVNNEESLAVASVWLSEQPSDGCIWLKGWSENEGLPECLEKLGIVKLTGRTVQTGFAKAQEGRLLPYTKSVTS